MTQPNEGKEAKEKPAHSERHADADARTRQLAEQRRREIDRAIMNWKDPNDPGHKTTDSAVDKAEQEFDSKARRDFCHQAGQTEHEKWSAQRREQETRAGRVEGRDYGVSVMMRHPDGHPVYLDYVDYKTDTITDLKPLAQAETDKQLASRYEEQRSRHIAAYEHSTGRKVFSYDYVTYNSSSDLYREGEKK